jgi:hypothetical protein
LIALIAAFGSASVADAQGYMLDAKGNCHAPGGKFAKKELCAPPKRCRDDHGRFAKCGMPHTHPA